MSKVVVIGSGFGGLTCAYTLLKNGYEVIVLEQGAQTGGCLQCFSRRGVKFETGMHFIGSAAKGQIMDSLMRYFDLCSGVTLSPLDADGYNTVDICGARYRFPVGREAFIERMASYFPSQKDALKRYVDIIDGIQKASSLRNIAMPSHDISALSEYQTRSVNEVLDSVFSDPHLKDVLVGDMPLYGAQFGKTPFSLHAFIMDFYNNSAFRIAGGSDSIASTLVHNIEKMGGSVLTGKKAVRILCDQTKATGVETADQCRYDADYVISTVHPSRMLEMLDTHLIRPAFRTRINSIPQSPSVFALYVKFKDRAVPYMNTNWFGYDSDTPWGCEVYDAESWPRNYLYMHMCHEHGAQWARSGVVLSYMNFSEVQPWCGTAIGRRGEEYEKFKTDRARRLIAAVDERHKGFASSIDSYYTSTPLTYLDYTGTQDGAIYGVSRDITLGPAGHVPFKTRIPNLLLAGQNVNSHGIMGVMVGTFLACGAIVGQEKLYEQIFENNAI